MENTKEHQLVLRVMRLAKPSFLSNIPIMSENNDFASTKDSLIEEQFVNSNILLLPQSFGSIFLGETFVCYLSINNDSDKSTSNITLKADLQTSSQKTILLHEMVATDLSSGCSNDHIISHEVKELGTHMLVCAVTYHNSANEKKLFRKFFRFDVQKPLDVKTKSFNVDSNKLFLEAQVQNITKAPICMEKVSIESSPLYTSESLNTICEDSDESLSYLNPYEIRQYLYMLELKPEYFHFSLTEKVATIGKLDIVWRSNLGERGRLQTSQLQRTVNQQEDLSVNVLEFDGKCIQMKPFIMKCNLTNLSDSPKKVELNFIGENSNVLGLKITGFTGGIITAKEIKEFSISLFPTCSGLQVISGLCIKEAGTNRIHKFDELQVLLVLPQDTD